MKLAIASLSSVTCCVCLDTEGGCEFCPPEPEWPEYTARFEIVKEEESR